MAGKRDPNADQVTLTVTDAYRFEPASLTIEAGRLVQVMLVNAGQSDHDFTLSDDVSSPVKVVVNGASALPRPPSHSLGPALTTFICSQLWHEISGMRGALSALTAESVG